MEIRIYIMIKLIFYIFIHINRVCYIMKHLFVGICVDFYSLFILISYT